MVEVCSFCGKKIGRVEKMIKNPRNNIYICDNCIRTCMSLISKDDDDSNGETKATGGFLDGIDGLSPRQIHHELDRFIIGQEYAKKVLSVAVYNHNKRLHDPSGLIKKSNILLAGPTGCGKTLLAKTLAKMLGVPYVITDATKLTEAGYIGDDVEICLQNLIDAADGDIELAQRGIVYIDEIDKIARTGEGRSISRDVSGEGVQSSLLKLVEGCEVSIPVHSRKKIANGESIMFNTLNVLFIVGGAFEGLFNESKTKTIGFGTDDLEMVDADKVANEKLTEESLKKYGMMPELVGRFPVLCALTELKEDDLVRILTEPEDAITKEYQLLFEKDNVKLTYDEDALREMAKIAIAKNTGARGLRSIIEDVMLDVMYDIPDRENVKEVIVTKDSITSKKVKIIEK